MLRTVLSVSTFLLTLAACVWATVGFSRGRIEADLTMRSVEELTKIEGFRPELCEVVFLGRDGQLLGEVQTQAQKDAAEQRLSELYGVRIIESSLVVRPFDIPWIQLVRSAQDEGGEMVRVTGLLASQTERRRVTDVITRVAGQDAGIDMQIDVREKVENAVWLEQAVAVLGALVAQAEGASAKLRDGKFAIAGEVSDARAKHRLAAFANEHFDVAGVSLDIELSVAPPLEPAGFEMWPPDGAEIAVSGRIADLATAERLLSALRSGGDWIINDQIVVAQNTRPAPWVDGLLLLLPSMMNEVSGAGIKIEGAQVKLEGQLESEGMSEAIGELARQNFPAPEFEVQNRLRVVAPPRDAMVSLITYPSGRLQLKGLLAEAALKERIVEAVKGSMPGGELQADELQIGSNVLEANWGDALVELIPPYVKQVKRGGLTIYSNILAVDAVIDSDADRDAIWAMTEQHFPDDNYRRLLELRFPEQVDRGLASDGDPDAP